MMIPMFLKWPAMGLSGGGLKTGRAGRDRFGRRRPTSRIRMYYTNRRTLLRAAAGGVGRGCGLGGAVGLPVGREWGVWCHGCGGCGTVRGGGGQRGVFPGGRERPTWWGEGTCRLSGFWPGGGGGGG